MVMWMRPARTLHTTYLGWKGFVAEAAARSLVRRQRRVRLFGLAMGIATSPTIVGLSFIRILGEM
jgi:hypothetical protein